MAYIGPSSATLVLVSVFSYATVTASGGNLRGLALMSSRVAGSRGRTVRNVARAHHVLSACLTPRCAAIRVTTRRAAPDGRGLAWPRMLADLVAAEPFGVVFHHWRSGSMDHVIVRDALRDIVRPERLSTTRTSRTPPSWGTRRRRPRISGPPRLRLAHGT